MRGETHFSIFLKPSLIAYGHLTFFISKHVRQRGNSSCGCPGDAEDYLSNARSGIIFAMIGNALAFSVMEIIGNNDGYDGLAILPDMLKEVGVSLTLVTLDHRCWLNPFDEP